MDTIDNIRTFLSVVRFGSFSAAARAQDTVPSVVSKRVSQLEHLLKTQLFKRSTRGLTLTESGRIYNQRFLATLPDLDAVLRDGVRSPSALVDHLRIKCPTTLATFYIADVLVDFLRDHPGVRIDLVLLDRSVNPVEEGFDIAIGALPTTYPNVTEVSLCSMKRMLVASPAYLDARGTPTRPRDLAAHDCVIFTATGTNWAFEGPSGTVSVDMQSTFTTNDSSILLKAVKKGLGLSILAQYIVQSAVSAGHVVALLPEFQPPGQTIKAMIPENRRTNATVQAIVERLVHASHPSILWGNDHAPSP